MEAERAKLREQIHDKDSRQQAAPIHADMAAAGFFLWLWLALWLFDKLNIAQFDLGTEQSGQRTKYVKSFRLGEFGEGDMGVTIVEFH